MKEQTGTAWLNRDSKGMLLPINLTSLMRLGFTAEAQKLETQ